MIQYQALTHRHCTWRSRSSRSVLLTLDNCSFLPTTGCSSERYGVGSSPSPGTRSFYMLECEQHGGPRTAILKDLDPLLPTSLNRNTTTFSLACGRLPTEAAQTISATYYILPNVARRLLDVFLAFRYPGSTDATDGRSFGRRDLTAQQHARVERFLNVHSHGDAIPQRWARSRGSQ